MERGHTDNGWCLVDSPGTLERDAITFMRRFKLITELFESINENAILAEQLEQLFVARVWYTSEEEPVVSPEGREGVLIGNGDGTVSGQKIHFFSSSDVTRHTAFRWLP